MYEMIPYQQPTPKKKRKWFTPLLLVCIGFGSGYASHQGTQFLFNQYASAHNSSAQSLDATAPDLTYVQVADTLDTTQHASSITTTLATTNPSGKTLTVPEIANVASDTVVEIQTEVVANSYRGQYVTDGAGSGVILSSDGYIVTNNHVIEGARKITVRLRNGQEYSATLIGTDSQTDVAVIKIEATGLHAATLGTSSTLQVGELAVAIGNPLGELGGTVTDGIISALDREITLDDQTMNLLQTNAAINPGNSGGGLFNSKGELIGIVVAKSSGTGIEGIGFAIPIDDVKSVTEQLTTYGYVTGRPLLNMSLLEVNSQQLLRYYGVSQLGVYIATLPSGSNGEAAGFKVGDCILSIEGKSVSSVAEIKSVLANYKPNQTVTLEIKRSGQTLSLPLILTESKPSV
jgi:serine protease Do